MPAIKARKQADGSIRYTAVVRIRRQGKVLHQEAKILRTEVLPSDGGSTADSPLPES